MCFWSSFPPFRNADYFEPQNFFKFSLYFGSIDMLAEKFDPITSLIFPNEVVFIRLFEILLELRGTSFFDLLQNKEDMVIAHPG